MGALLAGALTELCAAVAGEAATDFCSWKRESRC